MTYQEQHQLIDCIMRRMALRHGSSKQRDFEVACLTIDMVLARLRIGSATQATNAEPSDNTRRSEAK